MKSNNPFKNVNTLQLRHGHRGPVRSRTYISWLGMRQRCTNPECPVFKDYGGRGIAICPRWLDSFENFLADMGERPAGKSLDRYPNNDGHYGPDNCRWATPKEQANNRRRAIPRRIALLTMLIFGCLSIGHAQYYHSHDWSTKLPLVEPPPPCSSALEWTEGTHPLIIRTDAGLVRVVKGTPVCWSVSATNASAPCELMDVPAIQVTAPGDEPVVLRDPIACVDGWISNVLYGAHCASRKYWSCADESRILLPDVAGKHWHCIKFGGTE